MPQSQLDLILPDDLARLIAQTHAGAVYLTRDDNLRVTTYNALSSVALQIGARMLTLGNEVQVSRDTLTPASDRTASSKLITTGEGWLLGGEVFVSGASPLIGQTYAVVEVVRGDASNAAPTQVIAAGYLTAKIPLVFPSSPVRDALEGGGALRSITGTTPGAGAEISEVVPTGARWELLAFHAMLVTSAVAGNRLVLLTLDDGASIFFRRSSQSNQATGLTFRYTAGQGTPDTTTANNNAVGLVLPVNNRLGSGHRIKTVTSLLDVGDQWSAVQYLVREWIEGA